MKYTVSPVDIYVSILDQEGGDLPVSQQHHPDYGGASVWAAADWPSQPCGLALWQPSLLPFRRQQQSVNLTDGWEEKSLLYSVISVDNLISALTFSLNLTFRFLQRDGWLFCISEDYLWNVSCVGTTSSSNTVVAGQDNLADTDENKLVRESEER